jgi:peptidyl-prolyl cis-trans isomerase C
MLPLSYAADQQTETNQTKAGDETVPLKNAAVVNGKAIPYVAFDTELEMTRQQLKQKGRPVSDAMLPTLRAKILENLINEELLYQEAIKKGVQIKDEAVESEFADVKKRFKDEGQFKATLSNMKMSEDDLKLQIARLATIRQFVGKEFGSKITIDDSEAKTFYDGNPKLFQKPEQVHARHILIKVKTDANEVDKASARKKIEDIKQRIDKGEDFAELARIESQGPSSTRGGDLGFFGKGRMVKPFEDAAFALQANEVSGIVETQFGYHLIQALEHKPAETLAFDKVKDRIKANLRDDQIQKDVKNYVAVLEKEAKIERFVK